MRSMFARSSRDDNAHIAVLATKLRRRRQWRRFLSGT